MSKTRITLLFFAGLIVIWELLFLLEIWPKLLLPSPIQVAGYLLFSLLDGSLLVAIYVTLKRLFLGYLTGIILGIPLGVLTARSDIFESTIGVVALALQALPSICWAPLAMLWFGQSEMAMYFIVVMGSIWSISIASDNGVRNVSPIYLQAAKTMGSKGLHSTLFVLLPGALPFIASGMKQGWAFAWRSLMAAELYVTILSGFGLGYLLHFNRELLAMDGVIGIMIVIIFIGLAMNRFVFVPLEKFIYTRWGLDIHK